MSERRGVGRSGKELRSHRESGRGEGPAKPATLEPGVADSRYLRPIRFLLSVAAGVLLYLTLFPPQREDVQDRVLHVLTADWQAAVERVPEQAVALPEAGAIAGVASAPDLATALRRHPAARIEAIGRGLEARDRGVAHGRLARFHPAPVPDGIVELRHPREVAVGASLRVGGRVQGEAAQAQLLDVGGRTLTRVAIDARGRFELVTAARAAGPLSLLLRIDDADGATLYSTPVAVDVFAPPSLRLLLLAGAPGPETKYLRRYAQDAGLALDSRIQLAPGIVQGAAALRPDAQTLRDADLVILDERAFAALGTEGRRDLLDATHAGLGVLLRLTALPDVPEREALAALGFVVDASEAAVDVRLPGHAVDLRRVPLDVAAENAAPLLEGSDGAVLGLWHALGAGRWAVTWLAETYPLQLAEDPSAFAALWSRLIESLARTRNEPPLRVTPDTAWRGERVSVCGLPDSAAVRAPGGAVDTLLVEDGCALWWPRQAGLHRLAFGDGATRVLNVHDPKDEPARAAAIVRAATEALLVEPLRPATTRPERIPGNPWPWALALLAVLGTLWTLERRQPPITPPP